MGDLFEPAKIKHTGSSPWQRYKKRREGMHDIRIGYLTAQIEAGAFDPFAAWAERTPDWRKRLLEAICGLGSS